MTKTAKTGKATRISVAIKSIDKARAIRRTGKASAKPTVKMVPDDYPSAASGVAIFRAVRAAVYAATPGRQKVANYAEVLTKAHRAAIRALKAAR